MLVPIDSVKLCIYIYTHMYINIYIHTYNVILDKPLKNLYRETHSRHYK